MPVEQNNWTFDETTAGSNATFGVMGNGRVIQPCGPGVPGVSQNGWQIRTLDRTVRPFQSSLPTAGDGSSNQQSSTTHSEQVTPLLLKDPKQGSAVTVDNDSQSSAGDPMDLDQPPTDFQADSRKSRVFFAGDSVNEAGTQVASQAKDFRSGQQTKNSSCSGLGKYQKPFVANGDEE